MKQKDLQEFLENHRLWLVSGAGECADLSGANLAGANFAGANLRRAYLINARLEGADFSYASLEGADLSYASLEGADLSGVDLGGANLYCADLREADISGADLGGADLRGANLSDVKYNENTSFFALQCPEEGSFIGWKKCENGVLVKLLIPEDAKRSSGTSRKCRASKAVVLEVIGAEKGISTWDASFVYEVGKEVMPDSFNEDRWNECSHGIHFFITRKEAEDY